MPCSALTRPASRRVTSCTAAGRCCRSAASSATCRSRRWPRCRPTSAAATCGYSCCRCHHRARTRGCGGSNRTAPGSLPSHSRIVPRPVGENLRVPGRISPMRAAHHRRQAAGVSKAHRGTGRARLPQPGTGTGITMSGPEPDRVSIPARADMPRHRGQWAGPASGGWRAGVKVDDQGGVRRVRQATGWGQEKYAGSVAEDLRPRTWGISGRGACRARLPGEEG